MLTDREYHVQRHTKASEWNERELSGELEPKHAKVGERQGRCSMRYQIVCLASSCTR